MHDTQPSTVEAVKKVIPELLAREFIFVTVPEMFRLKNLNLENSVLYTKAVKED